MGRKILMTFEADEDILRQVLRGRKNPVATAEWIHVHCKYCNSQNVFRFGFDRKGKQRFICNDCGRTFIDNKAPPRMRFPAEAIASALNQFYESASLAEIQRQLELTYGVKPDRMTIYRWIIRYSNKAVKELSKVPIKVGSQWVADETVLKTKRDTSGTNQWFWDLIDSKTRFLLGSHLSSSRTSKDAQTLMTKASNRAGKVPKTVVTDKLKSYLDGIELAFGADTKHIQAKKLTSGEGTQLIERFHSTLKSRTKVMRSFLQRGTARKILDGWLVHYNFFRPHLALEGKTPAEEAGAKSPFKNWGDVVGGRNDSHKE
jgi:putative transposase